MGLMAGSLPWEGVGGNGCSVERLLEFSFLLLLLLFVLVVFPTTGQTPMTKRMRRIFNSDGLGCPSYGGASPDRNASEAWTMAGGLLQRRA
jgi:hypothetical protein